ncbi:YcaO-like family protein [Rhizobium sp. 2YAF20]|uniref:YcaO-like family protein n=1 Tax=Rhizobium sp. 2YAF20 TaxID=3233027 RepID=UPI003F94435C
MATKVSHERDWPVRTKVSYSDDVPGVWHAKAGMVAIKPGSQKRFFFGFSAKKDCQSAEATAYYECVERFLGSNVAYSDDELEKELLVFSASNDARIAQIKRSEVLIGATQEKGRKRNATGLALGTPLHCAREHAINEVIERHLVALWWRGRLALEIQFVEETETELCFQGVADLFGGSLAVSGRITLVRPQACFGSAFRQNASEAMAHAIEERQMLQASLASAKSFGPRHSRLIDPALTELYLKRSRMLISGLGMTRTAIPRPELTYCEIFRNESVHVVRAFANDADDISYFSPDEPSPFL